MAEPARFKYRAFLSYSHRDTGWAKWLHKALEGYRIDKLLAGRETPAGPVPKSLRPIFRDREDFTAGHSLTAQTAAALVSSQFLIVLCSPNAAKSAYVNEEIRRFKALGRGDHVIPLIVEGEPGDPERECFPPALRFKLGPDGALTDQREEPIAADARPQGDGKTIALAKVIAALLGVGLDEIVRRAERARRRRSRFWAALAGVFLLLAIAAGASAFLAWQQLKTNEAFLNATLRRATEIVNTAVAGAEKYNVPRAATLDLLNRAEGLFEDMGQFSRPTPELRYRKAWMLIQFARNYAILGDTGKQQTRALAALDLLAGLARERPDDATYLRDLSIAYNEVGDVFVPQGNLTDALKAFRASLLIAELLARMAADNADLQRDVAVGHERIGDVLMAQGALATALKSYSESLAIGARLVRADPSNTGRQRDLTLALDRIGDVMLAQNRPDEALKAFASSLAIRTRLTESDPSHRVWQRDLSISHERVGNVQTAQGNLSEALKSFRASLAISEKLAAADPDNAGWQRDLAVGHGKVGNTLVAQNSLDEALKSFRASLAIADRLVRIDPRNATWQRDLSGAHENVGGVLLKQGNLADALQALREGLTIRERLAAARPDNAVWQRDLSISYNRIGNLLLARRELAEALAAFRNGLAIRERLAARNDPGDGQSQRDLAVSHHRIGNVLLMLGNVAEAMDSLQAGLAITRRLAKADPDNATWQHDLAIGHNLMGDVELARDNRQAALDHARSSLLIAERLVAIDAGNTSWRRDLAISHERLGSVYERLAQPDEARMAFERALAIYDALLARLPDNTLVLVSSTVPLMRLGELNGDAGRPYLERALAILKKLDAAGRLEPQRRSSIAWIEERLARLQATQPQ